MRVVLLLISGVMLVVPARAAGKDRSDERLKQVTKVFVSGNNQAADKAREVLRSGKTCLSLATKSSDADATLDISTDSQTVGGTFGRMGSRSWVTSGSLTLKSGDLVWSRSERFTDAPFMSGGATSGGLIVRHLADSAGCKTRK